MPKLYVLVGVPGSGKTTWVNNHSFDWKRTAYISTDKFVESHAQSVGKSYRDVFEEYMPEAVRLMAEDARQAFLEGMDIVWDQTSTTVASRARKLRMAPSDYTKIAVIFETPSADIHAQWLDRPGKEIPTTVIDGMISNFEDPSVDEGFDEIVYIKTQS